MCLTTCPTGYTSDTTNRLCTLTSSNPLSVALQNLIQLDTVSTVSVGVSGNTYPTWENSDPIPSITRGYYFENSRYMTLSSFRINPLFTVTIWVKATASGNLITKFSSSTNMFRISLSDVGLPSLLLTLENGSTVTLTGSSNIFNVWTNIAYFTEVASGNTRINFYMNGNAVSVETSAGASPFIDSGTLFIGSQSGSNGFTGFLWSFKVYNTNNAATANIE